jgi:hypothetical protein
MGRTAWDLGIDMRIILKWVTKRVWTLLTWIRITTSKGVVPSVSTKFMEVFDHLNDCKLLDSSTCTSLISYSEQNCQVFLDKKNRYHWKGQLMSRRIVWVSRSACLRTAPLSTNEEVSLSVYLSVVVARMVQHTRQLLIIPDRSVPPPRVIDSSGYSFNSNMNSNCHGCSVLIHHQVWPELCCSYWQMLRQHRWIQG